MCKNNRLMNSENPHSSAQIDKNLIPRHIRRPVNISLSNQINPSGNTSESSYMGISYGIHLLGVLMQPHNISFLLTGLKRTASSKSLPIVEKSRLLSGFLETATAYGGEVNIKETLRKKEQLLYVINSGI